MPHKKWSRILTAVLGLPILALTSASAPAQVTFESLLDEMTNLEALSRLPNPAYTCRQFSSYDRRSTDPAVATDDNWFANYDRGQYLYEEQRDGRTEYVLMDAQGPGAIVRIWSANPNDAGIIRVYLDNAPRPFFEMPFEEMLGGKAAPFLQPIAGTWAKGWNSYLPIPYAKHCKVTSSKPDFYYHINYRIYDKGTKVVTLTQAHLDRNMARMQRVADVLAEPAQAFSRPRGYVQEKTYGAFVEPGEKVLFARLDGPGAVHRLTMQVNAADREAALRGVLLQINFDDDIVPPVLAPVGDFFGTAPGDKPYQGLPCGLQEDGVFYSHWVMPFKHGAMLRLINKTDAPVYAHGDVVVSNRRWTKDSLYFRAKWRGEQDIPTRPRQDWNFIEARGRGRFVGTMMQLTNPVGAWWGEGDEKIYVDDEAFPSHFGTGTEDYFGYAWGDTEIFSHAYHAQPRCDGPGNFGHTCVNRFHILDNIPFTRAFKFDMEVWHWEDCRISQAVTVYWYAATPDQDNFHMPDAADLIVPKIPEPKRVAGAIEGEDMRAAAVSGGTFTVQSSAAWNWSGWAQAWWQDGKPGDTLELVFPSKSSGRHRMYAVFTKAKDYGIAQVSINDRAAGAPIDFYNESVQATPEITLGVFELKAGENRLQARITGSNPEANPARHMFGLDYIRLEPAP